MQLRCSCASLAGLFFCAHLGAQTTVLEFGRPTDTISVSEGMVLTTAATFEAWILFTPAVNARGFIFNEARDVAVRSGLPSI
jgi:hypothetical protein